LGERREDDETEAQLGAGRHHVRLELAFDRVVERLIGDGGVVAAFVADPASLANLLRRPHGDAPVEDLALRDEITHRAAGLLERRVVVVAVALQQVDVVAAQALEAGMQRLVDVLA
jgi:hypothetical protein